MNDINRMRAELANEFAAAGAAFLDFIGAGAALAAIPDTSPQQYAAVGTLEMIRRIWPDEQVGAHAGVRAEPAAMDKLGGAIKMVANMLSRDNTPVRIEAAGALLAAFGEVAAAIPAQAEQVAAVRATALEEAAEVCENNITECCWTAEHCAEEIRALATKEAAAQVPAAEWISVDERLPEDKQHVAFVVDTQGWERFDYLHGRVLGGQFTKSDRHFSVPGIGFSASHWMPLPAAPSTASSNDTGALGDTGGDRG